MKGVSNKDVFLRTPDLRRIPAIQVAGTPGLPVSSRNPEPVVQRIRNGHPKIRCPAEPDSEQCSGHGQQIVDKAACYRSVGGIAAVDLDGFLEPTLLTIA